MYNSWGKQRNLNSTEWLWRTVQVVEWIPKNQQLFHPVVGCTFLDSSWMWIQTPVLPSFSFYSITQSMRAGYVPRMPKIFLAYTMFGIKILYNFLIFHSVKEERELSCSVWNSAWISYIWTSAWSSLKPLYSSFLRCSGVHDLFIDMPKTGEQLYRFFFIYFDVAPLVVAFMITQSFTKALTQPVCISEFHILYLWLFLPSVYV